MPRVKNANLSRNLWIFLFLLPGLLLFGIFTIYPLIKLLVMSFFDWQIGMDQSSRFIGFQNYLSVLNDPVFAVSLKNVLVYGLVTVPGQIVLGLLIAVLLNKNIKFKVGFRLLFYLPVITSWVIVSLIFRYLFANEGLLNYLLKVCHIIGENIAWLDTPATGLLTAELLGIWKGVGWTMVIFLAALQTIPQELYEAAAMDGCNAWQKFVNITLPSIRRTMLFVVVMLSIGAFNVFTSIKLMTNGGPVHQTEVVLTWMYYKAFDTRKFGYSAALSYIMALIIAAITFIQFKYLQPNETNVSGRLKQ